ncbi:MAG: hypothetical protein H8F28_10945 [Fibrella sp.]|nr:hypothetical protein [Armatimonadota bacterium]
MVKWSQIREIVEEKGDIHFVGRTLFAEGLSVPRTAFADHAAAQRFYAIAVDLWKANGNPSTVSPEARAEFPPPRILP